MTPDESNVPPPPRPAPYAPARAAAVPLAPEQAPRRRTGWIVLGVLLLAAVAWAAWHFLHGSDAAAPAAPAASAPGRGRFDPNAKPAPVATATARTASFPVYLSALGTVTPRATVTVRPRVDGPLLRINFKEGDYVKAGDVLAEIDPRTFAVQVTQADGTLQKDRALLANAKADLARYQTLLAQDSIARQQVDTQASLVAQYEATIASDQGNLDAAKLQLSFTKITAPIAGRLGLRQVDVGNIVHAADASGIVVITQLQPIDVVFTIPETNVPQVQASMKAGALPVDAWNRDQTAKLATGKVLTMDNQIDVATGTVKLKAEFANTDSALFPNQFVNVRMLVTTIPDATVVPSAAVQRGTQGTFVYVVDANKTVSIKVVNVGPVDGETTVITRGVAPGDVVVVDGTDRLREGMTVETVSRDTTVTPTGARRTRGAGAAGAAGGAGAAGTEGKGASNGKGRRNADSPGNAGNRGDGSPPAGGPPPGGPPPG
ncbi:MAG: MdtA/MuxA family multidrug efflux RND transporter periplasmic adaptor subunit [Proteobacteria bacterium]|nr:MdtA/MuxA family multidrug efflux RND transporter periplasmic adaptor subunit [Pseudomonadota bacterium]